MSPSPPSESRPTVRESSEGLEVETGPSPRTSVIWLHGLGADGSDFVPIVPALRLRTPVRFVFPHAPERPVTINAGMVMRAWYDVLALEGPRREDEAGIRDSARQVEGLIAAEVARGVAPGRVILAGFSQGGAMTLHVGLRHPARLGGLLVLSAYLPLAGTIAARGQRRRARHARVHRPRDRRPADSPCASAGGTGRRRGARLPGGVS